MRLFRWRAAAGISATKARSYLSLISLTSGLRNVMTFIHFGLGLGFQRARSILVINGATEVQDNASLSSKTARPRDSTMRESVPGRVENENT